MPRAQTLFCGFRESSHKNIFPYPVSLFFFRVFLFVLFNPVLIQKEEKNWEKLWEYRERKKRQVIDSFFSFFFFLYCASNIYSFDFSTVYTNETEAETFEGDWSRTRRADKRRKSHGLAKVTFLLRQSWHHTMAIIQSSPDEMLAYNYPLVRRSMPAMTGYV